MANVNVRARPLSARFGAQERRRAAIIAGSTVFHAAILASMGWGLLGHPDIASTTTEPAPIYLELEPRPLLDGEAARSPRVAVVEPLETAPVSGSRPSATPAVERPLSGAPAAQAPSLPNPRVAATAPADAPPAPADPWRLTPESMGAAVARTLRTGPAGCRLMDGRLNGGEQQLCDDRFNEAAARARPLGPRSLDASEARRAAELEADGARAMALYERRRAPPRGGVGVVGASPDCPGGNLRGSCAGAHLRPGFEMTDERLRNNRKME